MEKIAEINRNELALLWQIVRDGLGEDFITMRASPWRWSCEEVKDGLPDGRHGRLWGWPSDSFFPSRCFEAAGLEESKGDHRHQTMSVQPGP